MGTRKMLSEERKTKGVEETGCEGLWSHMQAGSDSICLRWLKELGSGPLYLGLENESIKKTHLGVSVGGLVWRCSACREGA